MSLPTARTHMQPLSEAPGDAQHVCLCVCVWYADRQVLACARRWGRMTDMFEALGEND